MGKDCVLALLGWWWCSLPSSVTATWARIALLLSFVWCSCSFLSWRRDSSLGLPFQLTIEIVQLQLIDRVFDVSVVQDQHVLRVLTWRRRSSLHSCSSRGDSTILMRITVEVPQVQLIFMVFHRSRLLGQGCGHASCCARLVLWSRRAEAVLWRWR